MTIEEITAERDAAISERDAARADLETRTTERDAAISERDKIKAEYAEKFGSGESSEKNDELEKEVLQHFNKIF